MSLRIIAGEKRGAALLAPKGLATRPTLGRVRESLFMILMPILPGARVLDGFAGSGALGLEALSRGASHATFIEHDRPALDALTANIRKLGWDDRAQVTSRDALVCLKQSAPPGGLPFDLILLDPPYGLDLCARSLELLAEHTEAWLSPEGVVVAQVGRRDPVAEAYGPLRVFRSEAYSETRIAFYRVQR